MKKLVFTAICLLSAMCVFAQPLTAFHNEKADTARINTMLIKVANAKPATTGDAVVLFANEFIGTPYKGGTLEGDPEMLRVNIDSVDCTTFVEMVMALAITVAQERTSWIDFLYNLRNIRYRNGFIDGYPSRLHYNSDWAVNNTYRGNFRDVTPNFPKHGFIVKTIDFMTANASKYVALADEQNLKGIENVEIGYRSHRFPYIKTVDTASKAVKAAFRNGDIVGFTSNIKNLDVAHMGVIVIKDGEPHVIHASSSAGRVVVTEKPLHEFMKKNRQFTGVRVYRLNDDY